MERGSELGEDVHLGSRVDVLLFGEAELAPVGVDAEAEENVCHIVVEDIEDIAAVGLGDPVLDLLTDRSERLRAILGRLGGECVAEDEFRYFVIAALAEPLVDIGRARLVARLDEVEGSVLAMYKDGERASIGGIVDGALARVLIVGFVGVLLDRHTEDLGELGPVAGGVALVDDPGGSLGKEPEVGGRAYKEEVGVVVPRGAESVGLMSEDDVLNGVGMLSGNEVVVDSLVLPIELAEREAPHLGIDDVGNEAGEPRRLNLLVDRLVGLAVSPEFDVGAEDGIASLLDDTREMGVHENVGIEVVEAVAPREIDILGSPDSRCKVGDVDAESPGLREDYDIGALLTGARNVAADGDMPLEIILGFTFGHIRKVLFEKNHQWLVRLGLLWMRNAAWAARCSSGRSGAPSMEMSSAATAFIHSTARS